MLVLSRKVGEAVSINHCETLIYVVRIQGPAVRLGISAARNIPVNRLEIEIQDDDGNKAIAAIAGIENVCPLCSGTGRCGEVHDG